MNYKQYQNEIIVAVAVVVFTLALLFKQHALSVSEENAQRFSAQNSEVQQAVALKKLWGAKDIKKKLIGLKSSLPANKVTWRQSGTKVDAVFSTLAPAEVNRLISKLMSLAVQIESLSVKKQDDNYEVKLQCRW